MSFRDVIEEVPTGREPPHNVNCELHHSEDVGYSADCHPPADGMPLPCPSSNHSVIIIDSDDESENEIMDVIEEVPTGWEPPHDVNCELHHSEDVGYSADCHPPADGMPLPCLSSNHSVIVIDSDDESENENILAPADVDMTEKGPTGQISPPNTSEHSHAEGVGCPADSQAAPGNVLAPSPGGDRYSVAVECLQHATDHTYALTPPDMDITEEVPSGRASPHGSEKYAHSYNRCAASSRQWQSPPRVLSASSTRDDQSLAVEEFPACSLDEEALHF
ncbi:uncharacterized protein LOC125943316 [Dermacentor silvarum]|uniref:uncharacterized protein LOC125943316 n=1 Tax=Dermacentor silvarum TaxID=543639 RepID=UPI00210169E3|nr:uncharacterized protein LOC125943316 [Dermacentor silvarum]